MAELKTKKTTQSIADFLKDFPEETKKDCKKIDSMMQKATGAKGKMWGTAIIGYGDMILKYDSGRELDWFYMGFSPRKQNISLYIGGTLEEKKEWLDRLGKHKTAKSCIYIKRLADVDEKVLAQMIEKSLKLQKAKEKKKKD